MTDQEYVKDLVEKARAAQKVFAEFSQRGLDQASRAAAKAVYDNAEILAIEAVDETHMGTVEQKIIKMKNGMTNQWAYTKGRVSKGIVGWEKGKLDVDNILRIAKPAGIIAGVMPMTNPTTTMGANAMQALKAGNAIIVCPHPKAKNVSMHCAELIREAIAAVGAPKDLVQCVEDPSIDRTGEVMRQCDLVVATGGPGMVHAANSSGHPSFGVGQGNCQVVIDEGFADQFDAMAAEIAANRAYDSGIPCTGEQTIILPAKDKQAFIDAYNKNKGYYIDDPEVIDKFRHLIFKEGKNGKPVTNPDYVGKNIYDLCRLCGVELPEGVLSVLLEIKAYGEDEPLCKEKMVPVSGLYAYEGGWEEGVKVAKTNLLMEGAGHSTDVYSHDKDHQIYAGTEIPVVRMPINAGQGLLNGRPYYEGGMASTSGLGCGFWQNNYLAGNLTFENLCNYTLMLYRVHSDKANPTEEEIWEDNDVML
ncbi:MAG: aldehyde dehydrogenase family protein [Firmicutes bacterium]|nr:aldehyde dehydrogenase family protein [Bacillota bacterium]